MSGKGMWLIGGAFSSALVWCVHSWTNLSSDVRHIEQDVAALEAKTDRRFDALEQRFDALEAGLRAELREFRAEVMALLVQHGSSTPIDKP